MKNDPRTPVFNRHTQAAAAGGVFICLGMFLAVGRAYADVSLPPPAQHQQQTPKAGFPSSQALKNQGYDPSRGVLRVDETNRGAATVKKTGDTITGAQPKSVTATGRYGEKATIGTAATQTVSTGRLETAIGGTVAGLTAAGGAISSDFTAEAYENLRRGDYVNAARNSAGAVLEGLSKLDITGLGHGVNDFLNKTGLSGSRNSAAANSNSQQSAAQQAAQLNQIAKQSAAAQRQAETRGDLAGAVAQAAAAKAANAAAAEAQKKEMHQDVIWVASAQGQYAKYGMSPQEACSGAVPGFPGATYLYTASGSCLGVHGNQRWLWSVNKQVYTYAPSKTFTQDATLNDKDVKQILERMLENQNTNHKELMNQLAKMGNAVEQATTSKEYAPSEAFSAPYTPQGSSTAQQTRFSIDKNGNVTATTIPRPDLKPDSSQAPTRTTVVPSQAQTGKDRQGAQGTQSGQEQGQGRQKPTSPNTGQQTGQQTPQQAQQAGATTTPPQGSSKTKAGRPRPIRPQGSKSAAGQAKTKANSSRTSRKSFAKQTRNQPVAPNSEKPTTKT